MGSEYETARLLLNERDKRIAELEAELANEKNLNKQMYQAEAYLQSEIWNAKGIASRLESALREIAEHPHCQVGSVTGWVGDHTSGHLCAAEIARKALDKTTP